MNTGIVIDSCFLKHEDTTGGHVECPDRVRAIAWELLQSSDINDKCKYIPSRLATKEEVCLAHAPSLYKKLESYQGLAEDSVHRVDGDTYANQFSFTASLSAAGGLIELIRKVMKGSLKNGFAVIRPPGHHAEFDKQMGFCLINNVVVAARAAQQQFGVKKVLIIDWDVHHGNGTQHILEDDPTIMYFSVHRGGDFFPRTGHVKETGKGEGKGYTVNVPFTHNGMGDGDYLSCFKYVLLPIAKEFDPDLVIVSAGFDCGVDDKIGPMKVSTEGFENMMEMVLTISEGKVVCALEGGYTFKTTADGVLGCIKVMTGDKARPTSSLPTQEGMFDIMLALLVQKKYWTSIATILDSEFPLPPSSSLDTPSQSQSHSQSSSRKIRLHCGSSRKKQPRLIHTPKKRPPPPGSTHRETKKQRK